MITQCVINLMSNAMRYTPEGGWVIVTVGLDRKHLTISVSDTGIGIAKEDLSRIFGRFGAPMLAVPVKRAAWAWVLP